MFKLFQMSRYVATKAACVGNMPFYYWAWHHPPRSVGVNKWTAELSSARRSRNTLAYIDATNLPLQNRRSVDLGIRDSNDAGLNAKKLTRTPQTYSTSVSLHDYHIYAWLWSSEVPLLWPTRSLWLWQWRTYWTGLRDVHLGGYRYHW